MMQIEEELAIFNSCIVHLFFLVQKFGFQTGMPLYYYFREKRLHYDK